MIHGLLSQSGLSLERLQTFCLIAEAGGITKAAGGDVSKQPLFSRQLKELETFFGTELMRRAGRRMTLTDTGKQLHRVASDYFGALTDLKCQCKNQPVQLKIGAGDSIIQWLLLPKLGAVRRELPSVNLTFLNLQTMQISQQLEEGQIDLGLLRKDSLAHGLKALQLGSMEFRLYVPKKRAGGQQPPRWEAVLARTPIAVLEGGGVYRKELEASAAKAGVALRIELECSSFPLLAKAVGSSELGAILPVLAEPDLPMDRLIRLEIPWMPRLTRDLVVAWNPRTARIRTIVESASRVLGAIWRIAAPRSLTAGNPKAEATA